MSGLTQYESPVIRSPLCQRDNPGNPTRWRRDGTVRSIHSQDKQQQMQSWA